MTNTTEIKLPEIKISLSMSKKYKTSELHTLKSSADAVDLFRKIFNADTFNWTEEVVLLCLNRSNKVVGFYKVSSGGFSGTVVDPKVILTVALNCAASGIMLAHNHPSGNLTPSTSDTEITKKIKLAASYLDIKLLDHIILTDESFYSFADEGII